MRFPLFPRKRYCITRIGLAAIVATCMAGGRIVDLATAQTSPPPARGQRLIKANPATAHLACNYSAMQGKIDTAVTFLNTGKVRANAHVTLNQAQTLTTAAGTPYCRIDGRVVVEQPAVNVAFQVSMPQTFNGRYFQAGQGGAGGSVQSPNAILLDQGFAYASTDRGYGGGRGLDFSQTTGLCDACGFHLAAVVAERVTTAFYGVPSLVRYVAGCSAGGADGKGNALSYGTTDFDGVLTGDNPFGAGLVLGYGRIAKYLSDHPEGWIAPATLAEAEAKILAKYDDADGAEDGLIQDDRNFKLDDQVLKDAGLSEAQIATVHFINSPWHVNSTVVSPTGDFPGFPIGRLSQWSLLLGSVQPPWRTGQTGAAAGFAVIDSFMRRIDAHFDFNANTFQQISDTFVAHNEPVSLDYSAFRDGGGKLVFYTGVGDGLVTYFEPLQARNDLMKLETRPNGLDLWARLYLVPGMDHCGGVNGPSDSEARLLKALIDWVEKGTAPDSVIASRPASGNRPARTFLLCPEPRAAVYQEKGDVNDAANWACATSTRRLR